MKPIFHSVDSANKNLFSNGYTRLFLGFFSALVSFGLLAAPHEARAQAQAANGVIEGTVTDASGAVVPNGTRRSRSSTSTLDWNARQRQMRKGFTARRFCPSVIIRSLSPRQVSPHTFSRASRSARARRRRWTWRSKPERGRARPRVS